MTFTTFIFISKCEALGELGLQGEVIITEPRRACLVVEFAIEMIAIGHYSISESLIQNGLRSPCSHYVVPW